MAVLKRLWNAGGGGKINQSIGQFVTKHSIPAVPQLPYLTDLSLPNFFSIP
jgi:hypothetical protein